MLLCELALGISSNQIKTIDNRLITNFLGFGPGTLYFTTGAIWSYDSASKISAVTNFDSGIVKAGVRWSGNTRAIIADGTESAGAYDGSFLGNGPIYIGVNNAVPFYLRSLKYYTVDRGTAWIQGQQA
jgi:hypothetical protein